MMASLVLSSASGELGGDPVFGVWRLNEAECQFSSAVPPVSVTRSYQPVAGELTRISETRLIAGGRSIVVEYAAGYEGREYPIFVKEGDVSAPTKSEETVSFRRIDRYTVSGVFRDHGKAHSSFTRVVSKDGQKLYVTITRMDSTGGEVRSLLVYDRLIT